MQAYHEATETATMPVWVLQRECKITGYARRSTVERSLDTGSIPVSGTKLPHLIIFWCLVKSVGSQLFEISRGCHYVAEWSSQVSSSGPYPEGHRFESYLRNQLGKYTAGN